MNKFLQKASSGLLTLSTTVVLTGMGMAGTAVAAPLNVASASLSNVQSKTASVHTLKFNVATAGTVKAIKLQYRIKPSGSGAAVPDSLATTAVALTGGQILVASAPVTGWTANSATDGNILLTGDSGSLTTGNTVTVSYSGVTNNDATATGSQTECDSIADSDTCYIRITTFSDTGASTAIDAGVVSYTVITATTVTATVDPSLTLTIAGVTSTNDVNTNDSNASCVGSADVVSTATAIPFGNIQVGVAKCAQQSLTVATNAQLGYKVYQKFTGTVPATDMMVGVNPSNNIDPFSGSGTASWVAPQAFATAPTGVANVDSGWLGVRTKTATVNGVPNFNVSNVYAPPAVGSDIGNAVMDNAGPDNGATPTFVTYKIMAGASQPADTYTGTSVYNVVASY